MSGDEPSSKVFYVGYTRVDGSQIDCVQFRDRDCIVEIWKNGSEGPMEIRCTPREYEGECKRLRCLLPKKGVAIGS